MGLGKFIRRKKEELEFNLNKSTRRVTLRYRLGDTDTEKRVGNYLSENPETSLANHSRNRGFYTINARKRDLQPLEEIEGVTNVSLEGYGATFANGTNQGF